MINCDKHFTMSANYQIFWSTKNSGELFICWNLEHYICAHRRQSMYLAQQTFSILVLLDLSVVFGTRDHDILIERLERWVVPNRVSTGLLFIIPQMM